jgi:hypothetical protein
VYVISGDPQPAAAPAVQPHLLPRTRLDYFWALAVVVGCTGLGILLSPHLVPTNLVMIYLLGVASHGSYGDVGQYTITGSLLAIPEPGSLLLLLVAMTCWISTRRLRSGLSND